MRLKTLFTTILAAICGLACAQVTPSRYKTAHSDSCWYFTFDYNTPKVASNEGMLIITHVCTPDTCISSGERHVQGRKYSKQFVKRYGYAPETVKKSTHQCTIAIPEEAASDTVWGVTYCEYSGKNGTMFECDTITMCLPGTPPMSCHRRKPRESFADHLSREHPVVKNIRYYTPIETNENKHIHNAPVVATYTTGSSLLDPSYLNNAQTTEQFMEILGNILSDSTTTLNAVQLIGYSSPGEQQTKLGESRAAALRNHIRSHHNIPDSLFEINNGEYNWERLYSEITKSGISGSDTLVNALKKEPSARRREEIIKKYANGKLYSELEKNVFPQHRAVCCSGIFYQNKPDSAAMTINDIVDELIYNPQPDYSALIEQLKQYRNDPRVLNLVGVIEYKRHHRHAAEKAFTKAAAMGDEQAITNLMILEANKESGR